MCRAAHVLVKALQIQCSLGEPNRGLCPVQGALFHPRTASQVGKGKAERAEGFLLFVEAPPEVGTAPTFSEMGMGASSNPKLSASQYCPS